LGDTTHVADSAFIELSDNIVFKDVTTLYLAPSLVCFAVAGVDANHVAQAHWVGDTLGQVARALFEQAGSNRGTIGGAGGGNRKSSRGHDAGRQEANG